MTQYSVCPGTPGEDVARVFSALLDLVPGLVRAQIDLFSDSRDLPPDVQPSFDRLRALAIDRYRDRRHGTVVERLSAVFGDPLMAFPLDLREEEHRELLRSFGPFSIHAEVYGEDEDPLITVHDSGASVMFEADPEVAAQVEARAGLPPGGVRQLH